MLKFKRAGGGEVVVDPTQIIGYEVLPDLALISLLLRSGVGVNIDYDMYKDRIERIISIYSEPGYVESV